MLPSEFLQRYGQVSVREGDYDGVTPIIVPADPNRYLLSFFSSRTQAWITPAGVAAGSGEGLEWGPNNMPHTFTHALHGSLVNYGWEVHDGMLGGQWVIIEGFMKPNTPGTILGGLTTPTATNTVKSVTQNLPPAVIPPFEYIPPEPIEIPERYKPWIPSEEVPVGTYRLIQRLTRPGEYRTPTRAEEGAAARYHWDLVSIDMDGFFAIKRDPRIRY